MQNQIAANSTPQSTKLLVGSVREQSISTIRAAIHSPSDEAQVLTRTNAVLALYFDPDLEPETKAAIREEFVRALATFPIWAVHKAFDAWVRTAQRRPTPGEIVILADRELRPLSNELERREGLRAEYEAAEADRTRNKVSDEARARIIAEAGMTEERLMMVRRFPMARSTEELVESAKPGPHWSDNLDPDDPQWDALRRARNAATP